jgi:hypothetical protein
MDNFKRIVAVAVIIHVMISMVIIFFPSFLKNTRVRNIYSGYLIPGPFFSDGRIVDTYYLTCRWREQNGTWSEATNPTLNNYKAFFADGSIGLLYRSRLDRSLYQQFIVNKDSLINNQLKESLLLYYKKKYVPANVDSVELIFLKQQVRDFTTKRDTLQIIQF